MIRVAELSVSPKYFRWVFFNGDKFNIEGYIKKKEWVWDCNNYGECISFWVVITDKPRFYKSIHNWEWHNYGKEDSHIINDFEFAEIMKEDLIGESKENLKFVI